MMHWLKDTEKVSAALLSSYDILKNPDGDGAGFVYLIKSGRFHKIGKTGDVTKRLNSFMSHNPHKISLVCYQYFSDASLMEEILHNNFRPFSHRGEWYVFPKEALALVNKILK